MTRKFHLEMPADLELELSILVSDLSLLYHKYFNRQMRETGLTNAQWVVLACLARHEGITQTEVADLLYKGKSPVGKTLDSLEATGWIRREASADDKRVKDIFLTKKLNDIDDQLVSCMLDMNRVAEHHMDKRAVDELRRGLACVRENLRKALKVPSP